MFLYLSLSEDSVHDDKTVLHTLVQEKGTTGVGFPYSSFPSGATAEFQVTSNSEVTKENDRVLL